jgi:hypothetical protein
MTLTSGGGEAGGLWKSKYYAVYNPLQGVAQPGVDCVMIRVTKAALIKMKVIPECIPELLLHLIL